MHVTKHTPKPVTPPKTYDITGLTGEEMFMLRIAMLSYKPGRPSATVYTTAFAAQMHDDIARGME